MSFREKTAWVMIVILTGAGLWYFKMIYIASSAMDAVAPIIPAFLVGYVLLIIIASIILMSMIAVASPEEADAPADEREKLLQDKAGNWSGYILGFGVIAGILHYSVNADGNLLAQLCFASLMLSQIAEYGFQIWFYRRGV
ncbi:MAG: hypothetical protein AAGK66_03665 [Pseudomonadota bacterium]